MATVLLLAARPAAAQAHRGYPLDAGWKFARGRTPDAANPAFQDAEWQTVGVPHDWAIAGPFDGHNDLQAVSYGSRPAPAAALALARPRRPGQSTPVFCYTSYPSAELFVNGQSQGRQTKGPSDQPQMRYRLMWDDVKYAPGTIKVVAYDAQGKAVAEETVRTAGKPHHLKPAADHTTLAADGQDLAYVTARVEDARGNRCPDATTELKFAVSGAGRFRAVAAATPSAWSRSSGRRCTCSTGK